MIRQIIFFHCCLVIAISSAGQEPEFESLIESLTTDENDTAALLYGGKIADEYPVINPDSSFYYSSKMLPLAKKPELRLEEVFALCLMRYAQNNLGNYPRALQYLFNSMSISEDWKSERNILSSSYPSSDEFDDRTQPADQRIARMCGNLLSIGVPYLNNRNYARVKYYRRMTIPITVKSNNLLLKTVSYLIIGRTYLLMKPLDSAHYYFQASYDNAVKANYNGYMGSVLFNLGRVYQAEGNLNTATWYYRKAIINSKQNGYYGGIVASNLALAELISKAGMLDSSLYYIRSGLPDAYFLNSPDLLLRSYTALADLYLKRNDIDSAVRYQALIIKIKDSLFNSKLPQQFQHTQAQLIQAEKMASLSMLASGIAHEIQNPLNFDNNFSDLNKELLIELNEEIGKGNLEQAKNIADDVMVKKDKIHQHGKRAEVIIKGMPKQSQGSHGVKELTVIKVLVDECLKLACQVMKSKDDAAMVTVKTDFYDSAGYINVIQQDIRRVLLNLFSNACHPCFSSKPTGQGTGLGLSLSYDIVKAHAGELRVETMEGEGSTFIIQLTN